MLQKTILEILYILKGKVFNKAILHLNNTKFTENIHMTLFFF